MSASTSFVLSVSLTAALATGRAVAQVPLHLFESTAQNDRFGWSVSGAGDVNGDGFADVIVGAPWDDALGVESGSATVFSGVDGSVLFLFRGSQGQRFGFSVSGAGDVDQDGHADLVVGVPNADTGNGFRSGTVRVYSGFDGNVLYSFDGDSQTMYLGAAVTDAGDLNGDGVADVVGTGMGIVSLSSRGLVRAYSGADGSTLFTALGDDPYDLLGWSVSGAGDVNGDGFDDLIAGAPGDDVSGQGSGSARVLSGADGSVLYRFDGSSEHEQFGYSVAGAGDVDGDGLADCIVGVLRQTVPGPTEGRATVFSGGDGSVIHTFQGVGAWDDLGRSVSGAGDVNGDGFADLLVSTKLDAYLSAPYGRARIFSGVDGSLLTQIRGDPLSPPANTVSSVSNAGDVNGDGIPDMIIGTGRAIVFSGLLSAATRYCSPAVPNSWSRSARIEASGSRAVAHNDFWLTASYMRSNTFGYFLNSRFQGFVPQPGSSEGNLCLGGNIGRFNRPGQVQNSGTSSSFSLDVDLTQVPTHLGLTAVQQGQTWNFQVWYRDGATSNFTDSISLQFD